MQPQGVKESVTLSFELFELVRLFEGPVEMLWFHQGLLATSQKRKLLHIFCHSSTSHLRKS